MFLYFSDLGPWILIQWSRKSHTKQDLCIFPSPGSVPLNTQVFPRKYFSVGNGLYLFQQMSSWWRDAPFLVSRHCGLCLACPVCPSSCIMYAVGRKHPLRGRANAFWNILPNIFCSTLVFFSFYFGGGSWAALCVCLQIFLKLLLSVLLRYLSYYMFLFLCALMTC